MIGKLARWGLYGAVVCLSALCNLKADEKVLIITHHFNQPHFIEIQHQTFEKFLQDEYEFVVFNDANNDAMACQIAATCERLDIRCIRIPQEIHDRPYLKRLAGDPYHRPNIRHANVLQYSMDVLGFAHDGVVGIVDSDLFLVKPISIKRALDGYDVLSVLRGAPEGITYIWPGIVFFNMKALPDVRTINFNCGYIKGQSVDSGGYMHYYLEAHPQLRIRWVSEVQGGTLFCPDRFAPVASAASVAHEVQTLQTMGFDENQITFLQHKPDTIGFLFDHQFLHFRAGTNYDGKSGSYMQQKLGMIHTYLDTVLSQVAHT